MKNLRMRLERAESEVQFKFWIRYQRMLEDLREDELEVLARTGQWPDHPEPAPGMSRFDNMDRASLLERWKQEQEQWVGRTRAAMAFFAVHGHWPEQGCTERCDQNAVDAENQKRTKDISKSPKQ